MTRPTRRAALTTAITLMVLILTPFAYFKIQRHLLRHHAESLFADVRAFQFHPGNFDDLQKFQRRWGSHARYEGTCTDKSCDYTVELEEPIVQFASHVTALGFPRWFVNSYRFFGGRFEGAYAEVKINNDRMSEADYTIDLENVTSATIYSSPHLSHDYDIFVTSDVLRRGYDIGRPDACTGCLEAWVRLTAQTNPSDIQRLSSLNLDCFTRYDPCDTEMDMIPTAWPEHLREKPSDQDRTSWYDCAAPLTLYAREARNAIEVQILSSGAEQISFDGPPDIVANVRVLRRLKNAPSQLSGTEWHVQFEGAGNAPLSHSSSASRTLKTGQNYILFSDRPILGVDPNTLYVQSCSAYPVTDDTLRDVNAGFALDTSADVPAN